MEYCPYGDLEQKIKRHQVHTYDATPPLHLSQHRPIHPPIWPPIHPPNQARKQYIDEREIWVYAINILEGLAALHAKGVVHRGKHAHYAKQMDIGSKGGNGM
jgi:serine/threonine protein kinase